MIILGKHIVGQILISKNLKDEGYLSITNKLYKDIDLSSRYFLTMGAQLYLWYNVRVIIVLLPLVNQLIFLIIEDRGSR